MGLPGDGTRFPCHAIGVASHFPVEMTVCAWCDSKIVVPAGIAPRSAAAAPARVSHGICPSCVAARIAALPRPSLSPAVALR